MYYPYLRAKQYELKALREFSTEHKGQHCIVPILEPVKQQPDALNKAIDELLENGQKFALVLNPREGDFRHTTVTFDKWFQNNNLLSGTGKWIPAFLYSEDKRSQILSMISEYGFTGVMLIFHTCLSSDDKEAWNLIKNKAVEYVVNSFGSTVSRRLRQELKITGRKIIRLDNPFRSQIRNADYALNPDEFFSDEPFFYAEEEGLDGYSDFTTLPAEYSEGGMMPYAVAIHLTYRKNEDQLFVHHFVSDSNDTNSDVRGKFREAAIKIAPFFKDRGKTTSVEELIQKAEDSNGYPGLGYLKKLSIKNHLELISSLQ